MVLSTRHRAKRNRIPKEQLVDMPVDVLFEIFLFLEPLDLLRLARATKGLREFLLNRKKASALWRNVIGNIEDFPSCPDYISPPAYTYLAFVPVCHGCFRPCDTIEWELRMRCCPDCFPKMTIARDSIHNTCPLDLPVAHKHYILSDIPGFDVVVFETYVHPIVSTSFSRSDWKAYQYRKRPRSVSREEFMAQQNEYWQSIRRHARLCQDWEFTQLKEKAARLSLVREQRIKDIKDKLGELGWTYDFSSDYNFLRLPEVRKLEPLTPTDWIKIRPQVISWAQETRKNSIWNQCVNTLDSVSRSVLQELSSDVSLKVQPRAIDIATLPAVHSVLESTIESNIDVDKINVDLKDKLLRVLPPALRRWSSGTAEELEQFAREQLGLSEISSFPLVVFECKICSRCTKRRSRFTFNEALSHDHLYKGKHRERKGGHTREMSIHDKLVTGYDTCPRNIHVFRVDVTVSRRVENLIKRMGQNPNRATHDELCRSTVKVVCGLCRAEDATRMNFECALDHCLNTHIRDKVTEVWTRVSARR